MDYQKAEQYVINCLREKLPEDLRYHNIQHTIDVVNAAERLSLEEGLSGDELALVKTAALYHDLGFTKQYQRNEPVGAEMAGETLPNFNYTPLQITQIQEMIIATSIPQRPKNKYEEIVCDADLDYLGTDKYKEISESLRLELKSRGLDFNSEDWILFQLEFLRQHQYFTASALRDREEIKQQHINYLENKLR